MMPSVLSPTVASLKAEGVELFKKRKYEEADQKFTLAIQLNESGSDETKAQCHYNRAAAREGLGVFSRVALIADLTGAILLKPNYGQAFARRYRYHKESGHWREALADLYVASHYRSMDMASAHQEQTECTERLVAQRVAEWLNEVLMAGGERAVPVAHSIVDRMISCFVRDDGLLRDVRNYINGGMRDEGVYSDALKMFAEKECDDIDAFIKEREESLGDRAPECWLLVCFILTLKKKIIEARAVNVYARHLMNALPKGERKRGLMISSFIISYETVDTENDILQKWRQASCEFPSSPDVYTQAFARLSLRRQFPAAALTVINDSRVDKCDLIDQLRLIAPLFTKNPSKPLPRIRRCESALRAAGLPTYPTARLASACCVLDLPEKARELARHIAERDNLGELWFELSAYYDNSPFEVEREYAVRRCLAADPKHHLANGIMAAGSLHALARDKRQWTKQIVQTSLDYADKCLETFGLEDAPRRLSVTISVYEELKAMLRAAEMIGLP